MKMYNKMIHCDRIFEIYKKLKKMRKKEARKVEANSQKIVYLFVKQERLKKQPKNGNF